MNVIVIKRRRASTVNAIERALVDGDAVLMMRALPEQLPVSA